MGRPPIGKVAMTGSERVRRYRLKHGLDKPVTKQRGPVTKPAGADRDALAQARARIAELEARPKQPIDPATLSMTAQQRMDAWKRQQLRTMEQEFRQRVSEGVRKRVDEIFLPHLKEKIAQAQELYKVRKGLMDKATFNRIRRGLHPDSRHSISDKMLGEAFDTFMGLEKFLLNEKDSPTDFGDIPSSLAEWDKMKAKRTTSRSAVRAR